MLDHQLTEDISRAQIIQAGCNPLVSWGRLARIQCFQVSWMIWALEISSVKLMVQHQCWIFFQTQQLCISPVSSHYVIISFNVVSPLLALTGNSQYLNIGRGVMYHPAGQKISHIQTGSLALRQWPHSYMWHSPLQSWHPWFHLFTIYFHPTFPSSTHVLAWPVPPAPGKKV